MNVGEYSLVLTITRLDDFNIAKYICDNKERDDLSDRLDSLQHEYDYAEELIELLQDQLRSYGIRPYEL